MVTMLTSATALFVTSACDVPAATCRQSFLEASAACDFLVRRWSCHFRGPRLESARRLLALAIHLTRAHMLVATAEPLNSLSFIDELY